MMSRGSKDNVYALLRKRITLGEYFPGERLKENILAEEFGISRTPIGTTTRYLRCALC